MVLRLQPHVSTSGTCAGCWHALSAGVICARLMAVGRRQAGQRPAPLSWANVRFACTITDRGHATIIILLQIILSFSSLLAQAVSKR